MRAFVQALSGIVRYGHDAMPPRGQGYNGITTFSFDGHVVTLQGLVHDAREVRVAIREAFREAGYKGCGVRWERVEETLSKWSETFTL